MTGQSSEVDVNASARPVGGRRQPRDLVDILTVALIAAQGIRFVTAMVSGVVHGTFVLPDESHAQSLGVAVQAAADYADGQGVLILLAALGLTWWQLERWSGWLRSYSAVTTGVGDSEAVRIAEIHLARTRRFAVAITRELLARCGRSNCLHGRYSTGRFGNRADTGCRVCGSGKRRVQPRLRRYRGSRRGGRSSDALSAIHFSRTADARDDSENLRHRQHPRAKCLGGA